MERKTAESTAKKMIQTDQKSVKSVHPPLQLNSHFFIADA
jgi:hypothetical protein